MTKSQSDLQTAHLLVFCSEKMKWNLTCGLVVVFGREVKMSMVYTWTQVKRTTRELINSQNVIEISESDMIFMEGRGRWVIITPSCLSANSRLPSQRTADVFPVVPPDNNTLFFGRTTGNTSAVRRLQTPGNKIFLIFRFCLQRLQWQEQLFYKCD